MMSALSRFFTLPRSLYVAAFIVGISISFKVPFVYLFAPWLAVELVENSFHSPLLTVMRRACTMGALTYLGCVFWWMPSAIQAIAGSSWFMTAMMLLAFISYQSLTFAGLIAGTYIKHPVFRPVCVGLFFGIVQEGFPSVLGMSAGEGLAAHGVFKSIVSVVGANGLSLLFGTFTGAIYATLHRKSRLGAAISALTFLFVVGCAVGARSFSKNFQISTDLRRPLNILAIQTANTPATRENLGGSEAYLKDFYSTLRNTLQLQQKKPDLIVTPEGGMIRSPAHVFDSAQSTRWSEFVDTDMAPLINEFGVEWLGVFGAASLEDLSLSKGRIPLHIPSAFLFNLFGDAVDRVPKASLIPFIEAIPYTQYLGGLRSLFPWAGARSDLIDRSVMQVRDYKIGVQICYDSLFRKNYQRLQSENADLNLVLTNDFLLSEPGAWIHHYLTQVRALEFGIPTYFVGNAGFTGWVDKPQGHWLKRDFFPVQIQSQGSPTLYGRYVSQWLEPLLEYITATLLLILIILLSADMCRRRDALGKAVLRFFRQEALQGIILGGMTIAILNLYIVQVIFVPSQSMEPLLHPGDRALICKITKPQRGEVISFLEVFSGNQLIKRAFLQPGDHYEWRDGKPILNGEEISVRPLPGQKSAFLNFEIQVAGAQPYRVQVKDLEALWPKTNLEMKESEFFVLGDARDQSIDSRSYGPIEKSTISGVMCWP